jgi:hypothetical protein
MWLLSLSVDSQRRTEAKENAFERHKVKHVHSSPILKRSGYCYGISPMRSYLDIRAFRGG